MLLLLQLVLGCLKFLMFIAESVYLSFQLIRLLFFNSLDVSLCDLFDFGQATVTEAIAFKVNVY